MWIRFVADVELGLCQYAQGVEWVGRRTFRRGEVYLVGEFSPTDGGNLVEFLGLGYALVPAGAWVEDLAPHYWLNPNHPSKN